MAETPSWLYQYPEVKDDSWLDQYKEVKEKPFLDISETASALGRAATSLPTTTMASLSQAWEGLDNPWKRSEGYLARRQEMQALQDELAKEEEEAAASGDISTVSSTIREATPSLGFSGATLIPSIGAAAGTLALSKSPMAARGAAAATSALMAYRMAGAQFLDDAKDRIDSYFAENLNRELTEQEKEEAYQELLPLARKFGAAEAGPEALGNLALGGAGKYIRRALGGKGGVMELASNALGKVTGTKAALAGAGALTSEIGTEAMTGVEEKRIQKQFEEGVMRGEAPESVPLEERTLDDYIKSFKEVAPATIAMTGMMGAAGLGPTAIARGIKALRPTPPERQTQIQKDLQAETGATPQDTVPDQTNEEKLAAMEAGGTTVVDPDGKTAVIPPQQPELPSMPSPDEVAVQLNTDAAESLKAAGSSESAKAQVGFDATLKEILPKTSQPTIPTLEEREEVAPIISKVEAINKSKKELDQQAKSLGYDNARQMNLALATKEDLTEEQRQVLDSYGNLNTEIRNLSWEDASKTSEVDFSIWSKARFTPEIKNDNDRADMAQLYLALNQRGDTEKANLIFEGIKNSKRKTDWTVESWFDRFPNDPASQNEIDAKNKDNILWNEENDVLVKELENARDSKISPASKIISATPPSPSTGQATAPVVEEPTLTPEPELYAPAQIPSEKSVYEEPQDRVEGREAEEAILGDQLLGAAAGEEKVKGAREVPFTQEERRNFTNTKPGERRDRFVVSPVTGMVFDRYYSNFITPPSFQRANEAASALNASRYNQDVILPVSLGQDQNGQPSFTSASDVPPVLIDKPITPSGTPTPATEGMLTPGGAGTERDNLADLIAVRDNKATPEQVQSLVDQGLVEQLEGQNIITAAGVAAMPENERPKLTPDERAAEVKGMAVPVERDATKPEQMTPEERFNQPPVEPVIPKSFPIGKSSRSTQRRLLAQFNKGLAWAEKNDSERASLSAFQKRNDLLRARDRTGNFGTDRAADDYAFWKGASAFFEAKQINQERVNERNLPNEQKVAQHVEDLLFAFDSKEPVSAAAVDTYGITLPKGYVKQGDLYVFQPGATGETPVQAAPPAAQAVKATAPGPFLTYSEWRDRYGEKNVTANPRPNKMGVVNVDRSLKIAAGKNAKINERNSAAYRDYVAEWESSGGNLSQLEGQNDLGEDVLEATASWVARERGRDAAVKILEESGKYEKNPDGRFTRKQLPQTATVATQNETAAPSAKGAAVASAVEQPVEGSIPTVGKVSPETEISSRENLGPKAAAAKKKQAAADEAAKKRQEKQDNATKSSLNSVVGPQKEDAIQGTVTKADVETARETLTNSGEIPNAYLTNVYESVEAFLADKVNERLFPASYARLQTEKNVEGLYENGQTLIFAKQIQVSDLDRNLAKMLGITPEQAAARRVIAHENGHKAISLFTLAEKRELRGYLMRAYSDEQIAKLVEKYTEYADWRTNPESRFEALEELLMRDFERMDKIPTGGVWDDIVQFLKRVWRRLTGQKGEPTLKNLKDVARLMRNAMKRPAVPLGSFTLKDGGKVKLSFIGEKAIENFPEERRQFMRDSLDAAKAMAAAGKSSEEIRAATGWFPNPYDGKMRWELPDTGARLTSAWGELKESSAFGPKTSIKLDAVIDHPELFTAYPELADVAVSKQRGFFDIFGAIQGWFNPDSNTLNVTPNADEPLSTILHEIQHWIQKKEGFAKGSNTEAAMKELSPSQKQKTADQMKAKAQELIAKEEKNISSAEAILSTLESANEVEFDFLLEAKDKAQKGLLNAQREFGTATPQSQKAYEMLKEAEKNLLSSVGIVNPLSNWDVAYPIKTAQSFDKLKSDTLKKRDKARETIINHNNLLTSMLDNDEQFEKAVKAFNLAYELYKNVAGEIEARDVQARKDLTPEQRAATAPYSSENIAPEDAIVLFGSGPQASVQFASDTDAATSAGNEAARSTIYSERDMDVREAIRRAYEAMPKDTSVAVPIGELFAKTEELMPGVTQDEFSNVLQDLFEDNGAVLQEGEQIIPEQEVEIQAFEKDNPFNELIRKSTEKSPSLGEINGVSKKFVQRVLRPASNFATNNGIRIDDNAPLQVRAMPDGSIIIGYSLSQERFDELQKMAPQAASQYTKDSVIEELIHLSDLIGLRNQWIKSGKKISFDQFVLGEQSNLAFSLIQKADSLNDLEAESLRRILASSLSLYNNNPEIANLSLNELLDLAAQYPYVLPELVRSLIQLKKTGQLTETAFRKIANVLREWQEIVLQWISDGYASAKEGVFGEMLSERIKNAENNLAQFSDTSEINVTTPEGRRAGFVVVMPRPTKASRIPIDEIKEASKPFKEDLIEASKGREEKAAFKGNVMRGNVVPDHNVNATELYKKAANNLLDSLLKNHDILDVAESIKDPNLQVELGMQIGGVVQPEDILNVRQYLGAILQRRLTVAISSEKNPKRLRQLEMARRSINAYSDGASGGGTALNNAKQVQNDPELKGDFFFSQATREKAQKAKDKLDAITGGTDKITDIITGAEEKAAEETTQAEVEAQESAVEDDQDAALIREGEETLDNESKNLWGKAKMLIMRLAMYARADKSDVKTGSKASLTAEQRDELNAILRMPKAERDKARAKDEAELKAVLRKLIGEESEAKTPQQKKTRQKRVKMIDVVKKYAESGKSIDLADQQTALKGMLREMNKARPADSVPLERAMPWRKILSSNPKDVAEYRQRIFEAISDLPSFQNLTDEQKERLADLYAEAWENRKQAILDRMLRDEIKKARDRDEISEDVEKKLQQSRNKILEIVNLGGFNNDDLVRVLGERYGISTSFTEEQKERIQKLADQLQDEDMNTAKRNKLAMEFAVELAGAMDVPVSEIISNWWTSSVLFGPQTIFSIGAAFLNGGYSIATIGTRRMLAKLVKGDIQGAIEESILMLKGFARYLGAFKQSGRRAWNYLWTGDVGLLGTGSTDILNEINNFDQLQRFQRHKLLAEKLAKDPRMVRRYVGVYLRFVSRLLTALDAFNVMVTKAGTASLALRMSGMSTDKIIEAEKMLNLKAYKDQVIRDYFDNKAPKTQAEKALVDSYAEAEMYRAINKLGGKMENADYLASESAMTMQPTGFGGVVYDAITGFFAQRQSNADEYLEKMKKDWISNKDLKAVTFLALAYLRQFAAYNAAGLTGSKFVRYASNKFNQGLSFIPFAGLLRQLEAKDDKIKGKDAFRETIYRNQIVSFVMLMVGYSVIKAIQDEPDDEERGNFWNGGWSNLTPDQKKQMLAKGQKEYTMGFKFNGRWYVFNYQNWPLNQILSAIGSMSDQVRFSPEKWDEKSALSKGVAGMVSGVKSTLEIPALSGLQDLVGNRLASKDPTERDLDRLSRVASGWVGGFVPRILKDIDFYTQPELRKYEGLWEKTASHIPIYRRYVGEEYYDILGQQIKRNVIPGSREFMMGPTEPEYKILGALNARNIFLTPANAEYRMVGKGRNRRRLTQEEADAYSLETGRGYRDMLLRYGQRALQMPTERARAFLQDKAEEVRDRALKRAYRR